MRSIFIIVLCCIMNMSAETVPEPAAGVDPVMIADLPPVPNPLGFDARLALRSHLEETYAIQGLAGVPWDALVERYRNAVNPAPVVPVVDERAAAAERAAEQKARSDRAHRDNIILQIERQFAQRADRTATTAALQQRLDDLVRTQGEEPERFAIGGVADREQAAETRATPAAKTGHPVLVGSAKALIGADGKPADASRVSDKPYVLVYFSAHWCPPCRAFTPKLVEFYQTKGGGSRFEIVFVSSDEDAGAMSAYMAEAKMPWTALTWGSPEAIAISGRFGGRGIPCLVLLDGDDAVVAHSYVGEKYVGPSPVLGELDRLLQP